MLRVTHAAITTSLLRYGLVVTGSCFPADLFAKKETCVTSMLAQRILGLCPTTLIEAPHSLGDTQSFKNFYITHCAGLVDSVLTTSGRTLRARVQSELGSALGMDSVAIDSIRLGHLGERLRGPSVWASTAWCVHRYRSRPRWGCVVDLASVFV